MEYYGDGTTIEILKKKMKHQMFENNAKPLRATQIINPIKTNTINLGHHAFENMPSSRRGQIIAQIQ